MPCRELRELRKAVHLVVKAPVPGRCSRSRDLQSYVKPEIVVPAPYSRDGPAYLLPLRLAEAVLYRREFWKVRNGQTYKTYVVPQWW